ncbi:MAG: hypothetical protein ACRCZD_15465, partial [Phycicoccus sp.]
MTERPGEMDERDVDARFASIVAGWETDRPTTVGGLDEKDTGGLDEKDTGGLDEKDTGGLDEKDTGLDDDGAPHDIPPRHRSNGGDAAADATTGPAAHEPTPFVVLPGSAWRTSSTSREDRAEDGDDGEEHFEPPAVVLPPQEDLHFWGAVV